MNLPQDKPKKVIECGVHAVSVIDGEEIAVLSLLLEDTGQHTFGLSHKAARKLFSSLKAILKANP